MSPAENSGYSELDAAKKRLDRWFAVADDWAVFWLHTPLQEVYVIITRQGARRVGPGICWFGAVLQSLVRGLRST